MNDEKSRSVLIDEVGKLVELQQKVTRNQRWLPRHEGDGGIYFLQGATLGDTLIMLDDDYEDCECDCLFIEKCYAVDFFAISQMLEGLTDRDEYAEWLENDYASVRPLPTLEYIAEMPGLDAVGPTRGDALRALFEKTRKK